MNESEPINPSLTVQELLKAMSVLSHDLKSPIFSIDGFSELLTADYGDELDEDGREFLQRIRSGVAQLKNVLEEMNGVVRILARPNLDEAVDLVEIIDEVRLHNNYAIEEGGVAFSAPEDAPAVRGDRDKIRVLLSALISNGLTFNDRENGDRTISVDIAERGDRVEVSVTDNGIGVEGEYADQIFDLGLKLDKSRGGGPGYGLYLASRIALAHGGDLELTSNPGEGSKFSFSLPRAAQSQWT